MEFCVRFCWVGRSFLRFLLDFQSGFYQADAIDIKYIIGLKILQRFPSSFLPPGVKFASLTFPFLRSHNH